MKSAEEIMNMLDAFDLTGSLRDAGELSGVSHHTVARYVAVRDSGLSVHGVTRPMLIGVPLMMVARLRVVSQRICDRTAAGSLGPALIQAESGVMWR